MRSKPPYGKVVGVIGLGIMGSLYARHILAGKVTVVGYDIDADRVKDFSEHGGQAAASAQSVVEKADDILIALSSVSAYEELFCEENSVTGAAHEGQLFIDTGTLPLALKERALQILTGKGASMIDATVTGTRTHAERKELIVYASGDEDQVRRGMEILLMFANDVRYVGAFGLGTKLKLVTNLLVAINNVATAEALNLARSAKLDLQLVYDLIASGPGSSEVFKFRGPIMLSETYQNPTMRMDVFEKDIELIEQFAKSLRAATPLLGASMEIYRAGLARGYRQDVSSVYKIFSLLSGG